MPNTTSQSQQIPVPGTYSQPQQYQQQPQMQQQVPQQAMKQGSANARPQASTYQCPNCNGVLTYSAEKGKLVCQHCGGEFDEPEHKQADIPIGGGTVQQQATDHVRDVEGFLNRTTWGGTKAEELVGATSYSCPSCGASVTADQSVVSTSCPYCGNNMLVSGIATNANLPAKVLPFAITQEQAKEKMREHFQHKWYLSRKFDASLEHLQGVYVPYHLYDMDVEGRADYVGYDRVSNDDGPDTYYYYAIQRAGHASFRKIPVDGSSKMPDGHMDAIAPFSLDKMSDFSPGYVAGYLMEVPDETPEQCYNRAENRARNSFEGDLKADASHEKNIDGIETTVRHYTNISCPHIESCVLPVWLMHCTWEDVQMLFAVNGETGKCVGDLPVDKVRRNVTRTCVALGSLIIAALITLALLAGDADVESIGKFGIGAIIFVILVTILVDKHFMAQMHTAVEASNASMSYDAQGLVVTHRWRSRKSYGSANKAATVLDNGEKEGVFGGGKNYPRPLPWNMPIQQPQYRPPQPQQQPQHQAQQFQQSQQQFQQQPQAQPYQQASQQYQQKPQPQQFQQPSQPYQQPPLR